MKAGTESPQMIARAKAIKAKQDALKAEREKMFPTTEGRCEDYPCCGHEPGGCPDRDEQGNEIYKCARCGRPLPPNSRSSMCGQCLNRMYQAMEDPTGQDLDSFQH